MRDNYHKLSRSVWIQSNRITDDGLAWYSTKLIIEPFFHFQLLLNFVRDLLAFEFEQIDQSISRSQI